MVLTTAQVEQQKKEAEELLFSGPQTLGFAKGLFFGRFNAPLLFPYPQLGQAESALTERTLDEVRRFCDEHIDAAAIDRNAEIPASVVEGLARLGVLGMTAPTEYGGRAFSQLANTRVMEIIGGHCASTAVFVNAHHSIGIRALLLFGSEEQKRRWLPPLVNGSKLAAFALTETEAGSDASNVQTTAMPTPDGKAYVLNGTKRWITNGGIADVLTVMARTPGAGGNKKKEITAFLVTPDMPGFKVVEARMAKNSHSRHRHGAAGVREHGRAGRERPAASWARACASRCTVLDFGRTTFGASCTGVAKVCVKAACDPRQEARAVPAAARRVRAGQEEDRLHGRPCVRDGGDDGRVRQLHRSRLRGLHARNGHAQGVVHRCAVADRQRHDADLRRQGVLHRRALRAVDARRPAEPGRRGGQRRAAGVHRHGAASSRWPTSCSRSRMRCRTRSATWARC